MSTIKMNYISSWYCKVNYHGKKKVFTDYQNSHETNNKIKNQNSLAKKIPTCNVSISLKLISWIKLFGDCADATPSKESLKSIRKKS